LTLPEQQGAEQYASSVTFRAEHQGGPGLVHGGIVGAALDEACGLLATWHRFPTVTARIAVRYRKPVPINRELTLTARVLGSRGRTVDVGGELRDGDELLASAEGIFLHVPLEHFLTTPEGRAAGEAWRARLA
jgi:acyl-coenzyme A thioesterase PaaI-like protein